MEISPLPGDVFKTQEEEGYYEEKVTQYIMVDSPVKNSEYFNVRVAPKIEFLMMYGGVVRLMSRSELTSEHFKLLRRRN